MVTRSLDWIFALNGMWAQRDDWLCRLNQPLVCSGILLAYPSLESFEGLLTHAASKPEWEHGDQEIIQDYFANVVSPPFPVQLLDDQDAAFGQCLGSSQSVYLEADTSAVMGLWNT